ncbi:hypothetical protein BH10ACT3_BH10ACT3_21620 [soil metagenome]
MMQRAILKTLIVLGVPFVLTLMLAVRAMHRRLPWHPARSLGRSVTETKWRVDEFFGALEQAERRAERSLFGNFIEDSIPALLGMNSARTATRTTSTTTK